MPENRPDKHRAKFTVRIGTRGSPLALVQAQDVAETLKAASDGAFSTEIVTFKTTGDQLTTERLINSGGKGLFTKEIDIALSEARIDIAVHSLKDVPSVLPEGQTLVAYSKREDPREGFLSPHAERLEDLPYGSILGTASLRREAQSLAKRPDLKLIPFRGSVQTRLRKLNEGQAAATYLAMAGLTRLGRASAAHPIDIDDMLPAPCQGIVAIAAVEPRLDLDLRKAIAAYDHGPTRAAALCERAFLAKLDGSCRTPIAGHARPTPSGGLFFRGEVYSPDGAHHWAGEHTFEAGDRLDPDILTNGGEAVAEAIRSAAGGALPQFEDG